MLYLMESFLDEWGNRYERAVRKAPYKSLETAKKKLLEKGKGHFLIDIHRKVIATYTSMGNK